MGKLTPLERAFYIASMLVMREENANESVILAKYTGMLANPFMKAGD